MAESPSAHKSKVQYVVQEASSRSFPTFNAFEPREFSLKQTQR